METLSDIVAQMRGRGEDGRMDRRLWLDYADRIEAIDSADAWRSLYTPGNAAAAREALVKIRDIIMGGGFDGRSPAHIVNICDTALSAPPRNCDVGTPEEQSERMEKSVCSKHYGCVRCPLRKAKYSDCSLVWAQTPYAEEGAGE